MNLEFLNDNVLRVALYAGAASGCLITAGLERWKRPGDRRHWLWIAMALCVVALGFGREFSLGNWFTDRGRDWARAHNWYSDRRPIQRKTDMILVLLGTVAVASLFLAMRRRLGNCLPAAVALSLLVTFVAIRAVSYHNVDQLLYNRTLYGARVNSVIEIVLTSVLIGAVVAAGLLSGRRVPPEAHSSQ